MTRWQRWLVAVPAIVLCVAASQYAMRGRHEPTGNIGYLGTEAAGVEGDTVAAGGVGVRGRHLLTNTVGQLGTQTAGVYANGAWGVYAQGGTFGVLGTASSTSGWGGSFTGPGGVEGTALSPDGQGVSGRSESGFGVNGNSASGTAVYGALYGSATGHAGYFDGRVHVNGTLSKSAGSFRIDHPLDPENKYLSHSFVESPDMKNIYDGVVTLDSSGTATVELPEWFEALNKDFRYQLTCIGEHAPVYIGEKIRENRFRIAGGYDGLEVSWQVTGSRRDAYAKAYPIPLEEAKPKHEVGRFLHPELHEQPAARRIGPSGRD